MGKVRRRVEDSERQKKFEEYDKTYEQDRAASQGKQLTIEVDGKYYRVPTIVNGKQLSDDEAAELAITGQMAIAEIPPLQGQGVDVNKAFQPSIPAGGRAIELGQQPREGIVVNPQESQFRSERAIGLGSDERVVDPSLYSPPSADRYGRVVSLQSTPVPTPEQELKAMEEAKVEPGGKVSTTSDPFEAALLPFKELGRNYRREVEEGLETMSQPGVLPKVLGAAQYLFSPFQALEKSFVGDPIRRTAPDSDVAELAAQSGEIGADMLIGGGVGFWKGTLSRVATLGQSLGKSRSALLRGLGDSLEMLAPISHNEQMAQQTLKAAQMLRTAAESDVPVPPRMIAKVVDSVLPDEKRIGGIWGNFWEVIEFPFKKRYIPTPEGKKSVAEIFQPAVERLKGGLDRPFRLAAAKKQLAMRAGQELGEDLKTLTPKQRLDVLEGLKTGVTSTEEGGKVVNKFRTRLSDFSFGEEYEKHFRENLMKQIGKIEIPGMDNPEVAPLINKFVDQIDSAFAGKTKAGEIMRTIEEMLINPQVDRQFKTELLSLHNLPASTPKAVAEASKRASRAYLISGLNEAGVVSDTFREGYELVKSKGVGALTSFKELQGKFVPRDVALELLSWQDVSKYSHHMFNKWFMTPWKTGKVVLRPATHVRNVISNFILNDLGGLPIYRQDVYYKAYKELRDKGSVWKEYRNLTGAGGTFTENDVVQLGHGLMMREEAGQFVKANMFDRALSLFDSKVAGIRNLYNAEEQLFKLAKYMHNRSKGVEKYEAALDAMKWTFNYGEVTRATSLLRGTMMPFFTWQSKIIPMVAETAKRHPLRLAKWFGMYEGLQMLGLDRLQMGDEEWQYLNHILPEYIADGQFLMMPSRDEKGRLQMLNLTYMIPGFGDLNEITEQPMRAIFANPWFNLGAAAQTGKGFNGAPIYYDWEEGSTKAAKMFHYFWQQLTPSWVPYGSDWTSVGGRVFDKIQRMLEDHPDAPTWYQMLGQEFGFKIHAVDEEKALRNRRALQNIHLSEVQNQFVRRIRDAQKKGKSDSELESLAKQFSLLRQRLLMPKEAVGPTAQLLKLRS